MTVADLQSLGVLIMLLIAWRWAWCRWRNRQREQQALEWFRSGQHASAHYYVENARLARIKSDLNAMGVALDNIWRDDA